MSGLRALSIAAVLVLLAPSAAAEFGPESDDGWPINVDGEVLRPPVEPVVIVDPLNKAGPFTAYPYYPILTAEVQRLAQEHPDLVKLTSAGKSHVGLDVWMLEIADFANPDMKPLEERERVYIDGGTHSNEYSGVYFVTEIAQFLLDEYATNETAKWIVENRHTFIVPMVNPDGSNAFGRLNAMAVNVNRNFPVLWGEIDENPIFNNPGPAPASEPETQNVIAAVETIKPDFGASIHCCGNLWLHPYGVEGFKAPDIEMFTRICDEVFFDVRDDCGETWSTIYPASGITSDMIYEHAGASAWSYEMSGRGALAGWGQPVIMDDVREQERESWRGVLHGMLNAHRYGAYPMLTSVVGDSFSLTFSVRNDGYGPLTHGNLTIGGVTAALPALAPGESADVNVSGSFTEGDASVTLDYRKRIMLAPQGERVVAFALEESGGSLVGVLPDSEGAVTAADTTGAKGRTVPMAPVALVVLAAAAAVLLARRREV